MRLKLAPCLSAVLSTLALAGPAHAVDDPVTTLANKAGESLSHTCRDNGLPEETCNQVPVGKHASPKAVAAYADSWTHRALTLQYELANDVPLANAPWVGTHNSFNSMAYGFTISRSDSNQQLTLSDQLAIDVRSVELDVHFWGGEARVCHATEQHAGCTTEGPIGPYLDEIAAFLNARPDQVVLLYLEDHIGNADGYAAVTGELERAFGTKLYRSPSGQCSDLPLALTRNDLLAAGAQVIAVASGCDGGGSAWAEMVFDWSGDVHSESRPRGFQDFPDCGPDFGRDIYESRIVRYFEDSTFLTSTASTVGAAGTDDGITPETAAAMMRCGVDLTGLDQLLPDDGRLDALVWSWAQDEPGPVGDCAIQRRESARWRTARCGEGKRPAACRTQTGAWLVTADAVKRKNASRACTRENATFAVPRTGYENALLDAAATQQSAGAIWLAHRRSGDAWRALDAR